MRLLCCLFAFALVAACDGDVERDTDSPDTGGDSGTDTGSDPDTTGDGDDDGDGDGDPSPSTDCFREQEGIVVIEAESLPLVDQWTTAQAGDQTYIEWTGDSHNNNVSFGQMSVDLAIDRPGLYKVQWYVRVGMGDNPTEHNDLWIALADADDFYGARNSSRVYPKPLCEDAGAMAAVEALPDVDSAVCPNGSTRDGYFKGYSSGALDWRWSARTSDNDAHDLFARFDAAGTYTMALAARANFFQIDRIVIHDAELDNNIVRDLALGETRCP